MKRVILRGPALTMSGYGVHTRQIASWLLSLGNIDLTIQATPWGITPWLLDSKDELIGKIMNACKVPSGKYDVSFQVQLPNEWDSNMAAYNVGITAGVETDRCNPAWIQSCKQMDQIIVPSTHTKMSFERNGTIENMSVIPEAFSNSILTDPDGLEISNVTTEFNFLLFGQITGNNPENDRKNIFHTIRMMCEVFKDNPNVGLIIKTNSGKSTKIDRKITKAVLKQVTNQVKTGVGPKIYLLHGHLNDDEVASLYRSKKVNALVSLTRGEGFGLPILEAAASGLPVIATNWSAYLDFMNLGRFIPIDFNLAPIHPSRCDNNIFMSDSMWATAIEEDFKQKVVKFYKKPSIPREWANELKDKIRKTHSLDAISNLYSTKFQNILGLN